jgi:hypothetical protein
MAPIAIALSSRLTSLTRHLPSSSSISLIPRGANLLARQNDPSIIPSTYGSINSGPAPGTVVGIVLGSVGGFLLILWLIYTCLNFGRLGETSSSYTESVHVAAARRQSHGSQRSRRTETVEIRRERSPIRVVREEPIRVVREERREPERVERIIVEEERREVRRERSRGDSDEVVVIEEHSPPRRQKSKKERRTSVVEERNSGFRTVDPLAYGGVVGGRKSSRR